MVSPSPDQHEPDDTDDEQPAAICGETSLGDRIGGEDRQPLRPMPLPIAPFADTSAFGTFAFGDGEEERPPFPADELLPSDDLFPSVPAESAKSEEK